MNRVLCYALANAFGFSALLLLFLATMTVYLHEWAAFAEWQTYWCLITGAVTAKLAQLYYRRATCRSLKLRPLGIHLANADKPHGGYGPAPWDCCFIAVPVSGMALAMLTI